MYKNDITGALMCLESLGLTESVSTLEAFYECDPKAFYVALSTNNNRIIGVCGAPVVTHSTGFMGLYGVEKSYQKRGIGKQLFNLCLKHIGDRNCGLFTLNDKLFIYQQIHGFRVRDIKGMVMFAGIPQIVQNINVLIDKNYEIKEFRKEDKNLLLKIIEYDSKVHQQSRQQLLTLTLNRDEYKTYTFMDKSNEQLLGFGCIRVNISGIAILGPVYADNDTVAEVLVYNLIKCCHSSETHGILYPTIDLSESSHRIARRLGLNQYERCSTVFTKYVLPLNHKYIYCIHSPNFSF